MGLWDVLAELERKVFGFFGRLSGGGGGGPHHLEVRAGVLDEVEARVQPVGDGQRRFPYNQLVVHVRAGDEDRRDIFESAFVEGDRLKADILARLRRAGARLPPHLDVQVVYAADDDEATAARGFRVEFRRARRGPQPRARFTVLKGRAQTSELEMTRPNLNVGRLLDVKDERDLIVRRNDLVFDDLDDEVNKSVSRAHAHVFFDEREGAFRIADDHSAQGTHIFRDGRTFQVPRNSPRGSRLRTADEIYLGRAVVRFDLLEEPAPETTAELPAAPDAELPPVTADLAALPPPEPEPQLQQTVRTPPPPRDEDEDAQTTARETPQPD